MTLKECLAAARAEKLVAEPVPLDGEAVAGDEEQNRPATTAVPSSSGHIYAGKTGDSAADSHIYPIKPDDSCAQSEIYPRSTRISPSTPIKLIQGDIFSGGAQGDPEKNKPAIERVGPLGEIRGDCGVLRVDRSESHGEIGEKWAKTEVHVTPPPPARPSEPHLTPGGTLVIPFDSDPKYHWWKPGGQSVKQTLAEVHARMAAQQQAPAGDGATASAPTAVG
jgi:hypothetical protein